VLGTDWYCPNERRRCGAVVYSATFTDVKRLDAYCW
jgi:hypothetical protein